MTAARDAFVAAMRQVATTVTVVTTDGPGGLMGATVSAFTSLSADPPAVLVCLKADSRIALAVADNGTFTVNVLPEDAVDVAQRFAGAFDHENPDRFHGVIATPNEFGPILPRATAFTCTLQKTYRHATHQICIGRCRGFPMPGNGRLPTCTAPSTWCAPNRRSDPHMKKGRPSGRPSNQNPALLRERGWG